MRRSDTDGDLPHAEPIEAPRAPIGVPRLKLTRKQWVGLPFLLLIPVLALFGVFGERTATIATATPSLGVTVSYPERLRYRQTERLEIAVTNRSSNLVDSVSVSVDTAYLSRFMDVRVTPEPSAAYEVRLARIAPGETRLVVADVTGNRYWRHPASLGVAMGGERATVHFSSLVFP
ncbi:MAG: hypothetical protein ACHQRL_01545 [Gemmatimonadales bacterium]